MDMSIDLSACEWLLKIVNVGTFRLATNDSQALVDIGEEFRTDAKHEGMRQLVAGRITRFSDLLLKVRPRAFSLKATLTWLQDQSESVLPRESRPRLVTCRAPCGSRQASHMSHGL